MTESLVFKPNFQRQYLPKFGDSIYELNCPEDLKCFTMIWTLTPSTLDISRTNICGERAVKLMEELLQKIQNKQIFI